MFRACATAGLLPSRLWRICNHKKNETLRQLAAGELSSDPERDAAMKRLYLQLAEEWEAEAAKAEELGIRVVRVRIGVVLGNGGGALERLARVFEPVG